MIFFKELIFEIKLLEKQDTFVNDFIEVMEIISVLNLNPSTLYSFLNFIVGPLSVYVCALNRTFLLVVR